jgi:hypothetical protein
MAAENSRFTALKAKVQDYNAGTRNWGENVRVTSAGNLNYLGVRSGGTKWSSDLKENFRVNFWYENIQGVSRIYRVGFRFPSTGAYLHYGVGRGYSRLNGKTARTAKSPAKNPRRPKYWFNPVVKNELRKMDEIVEEYGNSIVLNKSRILLPENN